MNYFGSSINRSSTIAEKSGADILCGEFLAVKYNANGNVILCDTKGDNAVGLLLPETTDSVNSGDDVTIQIKDIGMGISGTKINKGDELTVDDKGRLVPAESGNFVLGYAVSSAAEEDELIRVDIRKCGCKA